MSDIKHCQQQQEVTLSLNRITGSVQSSRDISRRAVVYFNTVLRYFLLVWNHIWIQSYFRLNFNIISRSFKTHHESNNMEYIHKIFERYCFVQSYTLLTFLLTSVKTVSSKLGHFSWKCWNVTAGFSLPMTLNFISSYWNNGWIDGYMLGC